MSERDFEIAMGSNSDDLQHAMMAILKGGAPNYLPLRPRSTRRPT